MPFKPTIVVVVPIVDDAVADDRVLTVAELVGLVLARGFPIAPEVLAVVLDVGLDGGIFRVTCHPEYTARPLLFVAGAGPRIAIYKSVWKLAEIGD